MTHTSRLLILIMSAVTFYSCTTSRTLTSSVKPAEIKEVHRLNVQSYISLVEEGNRGIYDEDLCTDSKRLVSQALRSVSDRLPAMKTYEVINPAIQQKIEREIVALVTIISHQRKIKNLTLPPTLDSLLEKNGQRFGLMVVASGFTRQAGNYQRQVSKGVVTGILTLGMVIPTPVKAHSTIYAIIVDAQQNNVAFYKKSSVQDQEPLDEVGVRQQIHSLFAGYFWSKKEPRREMSYDF